MASAGPEYFCRSESGLCTLDHSWRKQAITPTIQVNECNRDFSPVEMITSPVGGSDSFRLVDYQPGDEPIPEFLVLWPILWQLLVCSVVKEDPKPVG
jgi:hypothetical protein